jgi:predicted phage terminase large subunit-like protein
MHSRKVGDVLHEAREPKQVLDNLKVSLGSLNFSAQYQQRPVPLEGEIIKWEWFHRYHALPLRESGDQIVQSWDTAYKADQLADYSVCSTWLIKGNRYYLIDILRRRLNYPDLKKMVVEHAQMRGASAVIIENKGSGMSLIDDLRRGRGAGMSMPIAFDPEHDKLTRMATQVAKIEAGHVFLPNTADWLEEFQAELLQFPHGRHDDQVDSLSQFLDWIQRKEASHFSVTRIDPRPTVADCFGYSPYPGEAPLAPPRPAIVYVVDQRNGGRVLRPELEYEEQVEEEARKAAARLLSV